MTDQLNELFALPINVKSIGKVYGQEMHTSDNLKERFIQAIKDSDNRLLDNIEDLVNKGKVIPTFSSKSLISFFFKKFPWNSSGDIKTMFAFYDDVSDKVFILIDNNSNFFGITPNSEISDLLVHELMHVYAKKRSKDYLKLFGPELNKYYSYAFERIFGATLSAKEVDSIISTLAIKFEFKNFGYKNLFMLLYNSFKNKTKLKDSDLKILITNYCFALHYFMNGDEKMFTQKYFIFENYYTIAYKKVFGVDVKDKDCFQEMFITSEVIASISDQKFIANKVERAINSIR